MYKNHEIGKDGESAAIRYLESSNYNVIEKNFRCKKGEIDIIAEDMKTNEYCFIEVKTRSSKEFGTPALAVNKAKQRKITLTTRLYVLKNKLQNSFIRFDVIEVYKKDKFYINHLKNCEFKNN